MKALILGGAGFVGRPLARALYRQGHEVIVGDNLAIQPAESLPAEVVFSKMDVCIVSQVRELMKFEPDIIYFLAARQGYRRDWSRYARTNVMSAYVLFEVISRMRPYKPERVILASSQAVYAPGLDVTETAPLMPHSIYGMTKLQQEWAFLRFGYELRVSVTALRYSIILGAGQSLQSSESGILRNWFREVGERKPPRIFGCGRQRRDFVHVNDVTAANLDALKGPRGVYNIGGNPITILEMAQKFHQVAGGPNPVVLNREIRPGGEYTLTSNSSQARKDLRWEPALDVQKMVSDFHAFAKKTQKTDKPDH